MNYDPNDPNNPPDTNLTNAARSLALVIALAAVFGYGGYLAAAYLFGG